MIMRHNPSLGAISVLFFILTWHLESTKAAIEEIEATPTNTQAVLLGDISMPQFLVLCISFLLIVTLYGVGVIPIEIDLGYFYGTGSGSLLPRKLQKEMEFNTLFHDCPMQYVCEIDLWANREDHEHFVEKTVASWFKNADSMFAKSIAFAGAGSCSEMYPCPYDLLKMSGLKKDNRKNYSAKDDSSGADIYMDLTT